MGTFLVKMDPWGWASDFPQLLLSTEAIREILQVFQPGRNLIPFSKLSLRAPHLRISSVKEFHGPAYWKHNTRHTHLLHVHEAQ